MAIALAPSTALILTLEPIPLDRRRKDAGNVGATLPVLISAFPVNLVRRTRGVEHVLLAIDILVAGRRERPQRPLHAVGSVRNSKGAWQTYAWNATCML